MSKPKDQGNCAAKPKFKKKKKVTKNLLEENLIACL